MIGMFRRKSAEDLRAQLAERRAEIAGELARLHESITALEVERAQLRTRAITRDDYARAVLADIDRRADQQIAILSGKLAQAAQGMAENGRHAATVARALDAERRPLPSPRESLYGRVLNLAGTDGEALSVPMAYAVFRDEIKRTAREAIERIEPWPFPYAIEFEPAKARLAEIEERISQLRAEEAELRAEQAEFGPGQ